MTRVFSLLHLKFAVNESAVFHTNASGVILHHAIRISQLTVQTIMSQKNRKKVSNRQSRRAFAKSVAVSLIAAPIASSLVNAQTATPTPSPSPTPSPTPRPPSPIALAYFEVAKASFGKYMTAEQLEQVKRDLEGNVRTAERFSAVKLQNGDEPDFVFSA